MARYSLIFVILFAFVTHAHAQDQRYTGFMGDNVPDNKYSIKLDAGAIVQIEVTATSGDLDPYIGLQGPDGTLLIENDDRDANTGDSYIEYQAEDSGEYVLIVSNISGTSGNYQVTIEVSSSVETNNTPALVYTGYMGDSVPDDEYTINLKAGERVIINLIATTDSLDPYLILEGPDGETIAENDDRDASTFDSYLSHVAESGGRYTVIVSNIQDTEGDYQLTIEYGDESDLANREPTMAPLEDPLSVFTVYDNLGEYTGSMSDDVPDDTYEITLTEDQALLAIAEGTSGDLDTYLYLYNSDNELQRENDDRDDSTFDSQLIFIPETAGDYTVVVSNYPDTSGEYRLRLVTIPIDEAQANIRVRLSGPVQYYDTLHFRIHYTTEGADAADPAYVEQVAVTLEDVWEVEIQQLGWARPLQDGVIGGDTRYDVYLQDTLSDEQGPLGLTYPELPGGDNPNTTLIEDGSVTSYMILDNDYAPDQLSEGDNNISIMRATAAHEFHHAIQFAYEVNENLEWYYEATATWMETVTFPKDQDATGYVATTFDYPEICFGVGDYADPTDGSIMYGEWLFLDAMVQDHGEKLPQRLWENIALYEGWQALESTLEVYDDTLVDAVRRFHFRNLVRDYALSPEFDEATVWLEDSIQREGYYSFSGDGVQEMAANYFELNLGAGQFNAKLNERDLELWYIGISGTEGFVTSLGTGGNFDTSGMDYSYLMVFNPAYDDDVDDCEFTEFDITIDRATGETVSPTITLDATDFLPLD